MRIVTVKGKLVPAGPESPDLAICPSCKGVGVKRSRKRQGGPTTYFHLHKRGGRRRMSATISSIVEVEKSLVRAHNNEGIRE
jgi:hypothetical protein